MYQQPKIEGKINLRVAVISAIAMAMIIGLIVAIIVVANTRPNISEEDINTTTLADNGSEEVNNATTVTEKAEVVTEETNTSSDSPYNSAKKTETTTVKNLPKTGPEDLLPLMLVGGMLVVYGASAIKVRRK